MIGGTVGKLAVTAFDAIIHALFAPIAHFINTQLIGWLVAVPDYAPAGSHVAATERTVLAMAGAALGAVATISIARFWVGRAGGQRRLGARGARAHGRRGVAAADLAVDVSHRGRAGERREHRAARVRERDEGQREPARGRGRRRRRAGVPRRRAVREHRDGGRREHPVSGAADDEGGRSRSRPSWCSSGCRSRSCSRRWSRGSRACSRARSACASRCRSCGRCASRRAARCSTTACS